MPKSINLGEYDVIGKDVVRILHRTPASLWVECVESPILRAKSQKNALNVKVFQAPLPKAIIGGNYVAADFLAHLITSKFIYHIPEYRQIKMHTELGTKLPTSTINDWVHSVANKLFPLYESLCEEVLQSDYLQIDEVPWKIADRAGKSCRQGYAWQ
ncbi:MAG: IS66 family transposase, partial [Phocaeicola sp.]